jgi:N6-adenosine-specific RNA methylase IME4
MTPWPFGTLQMFGYGAILMDLPWSYEMRTENGYDRSPEAHYDTMSDDDLLHLPIGELASSQCLLVMWAVWPKLPLAVECMKRYGFKYVTGGSWIKTTKDGFKPRMGTGYTLRSASEPFLIGRIGKPQADVRDIMNVIVSPRREHSRKPDEMRVIVERMTPKARRCELFAREPWAGNEVWGNEVQKFEGAGT